MRDSTLNVTSTAASATNPQNIKWTVSPTGAGPIRVGMTFSELATFMTSPADTATILDDCDYITIKAAPDSLRFMVEERRLVRIEVYSAGIATSEGAKVGDSEDQVLQLYPGARREPHKYTPGFYLIALPYAPGDTLYRYVFETDGHHVFLLRAGVYPPVEYVEGCL